MRQQFKMNVIDLLKGKHNVYMHTLYVFVIRQGWPSLFIQFSFSSIKKPFPSSIQVRKNKDKLGAFYMTVVRMICFHNYIILLLYIYILYIMYGRRYVYINTNSVYVVIWWPLFTLLLSFL